MLVNLSNTRPGVPSPVPEETKQNAVPCEYHSRDLTVLGEGAMTNPMFCGGGVGVGSGYCGQTTHDSWGGGGRGRLWTKHS